MRESVALIRRTGEVPSPSPPLRVAYLFTTFPLLSETFLQREIRLLREQPVVLDVYSIWRGAREFEGTPVHRFSPWRLLTLLWWLPYWCAHRPPAFLRLARRLMERRAPSFPNTLEALVGVGFAIVYATYFTRRGRRPDLIHAAWATIPASTAQFLSQLTGLPFSMGAHAYDVFRDGGDWLLESKLEDAALVVTSSESTRRRLVAIAGGCERIALIRRGLDVLPPCRAPRTRRSPLRILAIGRLVEKKGYLEQLRIYAALKHAGIAFEARIVGDGPLRKRLEQARRSLVLTEEVALLGALPFREVLGQLAWADVLAFTGKVAPDGDRDGVPNVVLEAMAAGVPVVASAVGGTPEAIEDGVTGVLLEDTEPREWVAALSRLGDDDEHYAALSRAARAWAEANCDGRATTRQLYERFAAVVEATRVPTAPILNRGYKPLPHV